MERSSGEDPAFGAYAPRGLKAWWLAMCQKMPIRRLALWMRKPLKSAFGDWVDVELWGLKLRLASRGNLTEQRLLYMARHYDKFEREFLAEVLTEGSVFFDIGANAGAYSLYVASLRRTGLLIEAFEPDPELCRRFRYNIAENQLSEICLNEVALGLEDGRLILQQGNGNLGQNEVLETGEGLSVTVRSLASIVKEKGIASIDVLKIDIEGHERGVLEPFFASEDASLWPQWVICEELTESGLSDGAQVLLDAGYEIVLKTRMNGIFRRDRLLRA